MRDQEEIGVVYRPADDNAARAIAYFGPYVFWSVVAVVVGAVWMLG